MFKRFVCGLAVLVLTATAQAQEQTIDFEGLPAGTIVSQVFGDLGAGPVLVHGTNPALPMNPNAAIIFDSSNPPGVDFDLGSPNQNCPNPPGAGPGIGNGGVPGATNNDGDLTENCPLIPVGNILIVAQNLTDNVPPGGNGLVDVPNDAAGAGSTLTLNFSELGSVAISSITLLDVEQSENAALVRLYADKARTMLIDSFILAKTGNNGLLVFDLGTNLDVVIMDVVINGSGAIDDVVFATGPCGPDFDCDDDDACTLDECDPRTGLCTHEPMDCDDEVPCTVDSCNERTGACVHAPDDALCADKNPCNGDEVCNPDGGCQAGTPPNCSDNVPCTADACVPGEGCVNTPNNGLCNDGNPCDGVETCHALQGCLAGPPLNCSDGVECTVDTCSPTVGCVHTPNDSACEDGDSCNGAETCDPEDGCLSGGGPACDDGIACTRDNCHPVFGCGNDPFDSLCDDGDDCTEDHCFTDQGCVYEPVAGCATCELVCDSVAVCDGSSDCDGARQALLSWHTIGFCSEVEAVLDFKCGKTPIRGRTTIDYLCGCTADNDDGILKIRSGSAKLIVRAKGPAGEDIMCEQDLCTLPQCP